MQVLRNHRKRQARLQTFATFMRQPAAGWHPVHMVAARPCHADHSITLRVYARVIRAQLTGPARQLLFQTHLPSPGSTRLLGVGRRRCPVPVRGEERGQRGQQLPGSLLGDPVAAAA